MGGGIEMNANLTDEESEAVNMAMARLAFEGEKLAKEQAEKADYKIQVWFTSDRRQTGPCSYTLSFWESGKRLHGGGDEMMFVCRRHAHAPKVTPLDVVGPQAKVGQSGCGMLIPGDHMLPGNFLVCPHCHTKHRSDQVADSIFYRTDITAASKILAKWWRKLDHNADIYVKYCPTDPRVQLMAQSMGIRKAREMKGLTIYPLKRIITDTSAGASVESRFRALLTA
jgi:hypothetical protein